MKALDKPSDLVQRIQSFEGFEGIAPASLQWLVDHADYNLYESGELIFHPGKAVDHMQIVVDGEYVIEMVQQGESRELATGETGHITGVLPFSRMKESRANGKALRDTYLLELHRAHFVELVNVDYNLVQNLVGLMSNRIREFTNMRVQNEKMMALGKLSAGLAHELNNPASAMVRSAKELHDKVHKTPERFKAIMTMRVTGEQTDQVNEVLFAHINAGTNEELSALERSEIEDDILDWLEEHDIEDGEDIANTFADYDFGVEDMERIVEIVGEDHLEAIMWWIESTLSLETLVGEIQEASERISTLIRSIKDYSHMDRSRSKDKVQIKEGIYSTLTILKHKLKKKQVKLVKSFEEDLPPVEAHVSQLNQVWTNLLDNALDALPDSGGELTITGRRLRKFVAIEITDNGPGIPEDIIGQIFDPFYTTKPIGEGTGMGLDITKRIIDRMKGQIIVGSEPGKTTFQVLIPMAE
jgi:signal transduction histidine kinase